MRREVIVEIPSTGFGLIMAGNRDPAATISSDWPTDAEVVGADWDFNRRTVLLYVSSATFDEVPHGAIVPRWEPTFTTHLSDIGWLRGLIEDGRREMEAGGLT